jgi:vancomycin aglycone glucosyltransferase
MRIAIAVEGTRGDVHPMIGLGRSLQASGHEVELCAPPDFATDVGDGGLRFRPIGQSVRAFLDAQAGAVHGGTLAVLKSGRDFFETNGARQFEELAPAVKGADLVVAAGTQVAASSLAELHGVPYRYVAYCPALFPSPEHAPLFTPFGALPRWVNRLLWWLTFRMMNLTIGRSVNRCRAQIGMPKLANPSLHVFSERPLLATDELLAPAPKQTRWEVQSLGCLHPFEPDPLPEKLEAFLDAGEPPVYVGFGSMTDPDPGRSTRLVLDAVRRAGVRAVLSAGWAGLGDAPLPENVRVVGAVSHAALFPRVAAVVHHGGAGTTTTAARAGVPQIIVPHLLDQFYWARRVAELGLGPPAPSRRRLHCDDLAGSLRALRDNDVVVERAAALGERLRAALQRREDPGRVIP